MTRILQSQPGHLIGSAVTWTYSPGLITGAVVWIPLGWVRLRVVSRASSHRARVAGLCAGVFVTIVTLAVLASALANGAG